MKEISIVIPVYNEEVLLAKEIQRLTEEMQTRWPGLDYEIFLVENGSTDKTKEIVSGLKKNYQRLRVAHLPKPDYGQALKHAILESQGKYVAVFNIDFWDLDFLQQALEEVRVNKHDLVVGSKAMPGAGDKRSWSRRFVTRSFNALLRLMFGFKGTDTHGIKLLVADRVLPVARQCQTDRVIFDTELILRIQRLGLSSKEIPVSCEEKRKTRLPIIRSIFRTLNDLAILFFVLHRPNLSKRQWAALMVVAAFFLGAVAWGFPDSPAPWFDEGINLGIAKTYVQDGVYSLHLSPSLYVMERGLMISTNYPVLAPLIVAFAIFGSGLIQAKVVMALLMIFFLLVVWQLVRNLTSSTLALASLALAVTFLPFYGNGLSGGLGEVTGLAWLVAGLIMLRKKTPTRWQLIIMGLCFGLCASTKVFYLTTLGALAVSEVWLAWQEKKFPLQRWLYLALGIVGPLVIWLRSLLPQGLTPASLAATLAYYRNPYQVEHTVLANIMKFFTESTLLHFLVLFTALFVYLSINYRQKTLERWQIAVGVFVALNVVWFVRTPGWFRYLFPAQLLLLVLFPVTLAGIMSRFTFLKNKALLVVVALFVAQSGHFFLNRSTRLYYNPAPRQFASYLEQLPATSTIMMVDQPELWFLTNRATEQRLQMNPHVAFGRNFLETAQPDYVVVTNPGENIFISTHQKDFQERYYLVKQFDRYSLFTLK